MCPPSVSLGPHGVGLPPPTLNTKFDMMRPDFGQVWPIRFGSISIVLGLLAISIGEGHFGANLAEWCSMIVDLGDSIDAALCSVPLPLGRRQAHQVACGVARRWMVDRLGMHVQPADTEIMGLLLVPLGCAEERAVHVVVAMSCILSAFGTQRSGSMVAARRLFDARLKEVCMRHRRFCTSLRRPWLQRCILSRGYMCSLGFWAWIAYGVSVRAGFRASCSGGKRSRLHFVLCVFALFVVWFGSIGAMPHIRLR